MDKEQLIQQYIANRLSEADKLSVEKQLETDAEFKLEFEAHKDISMAFKLAEAQNLKSRFKSLEKTKQKSNKFLNKKLLYLGIASLFIISLFYTLNGETSGQNLYDSNFTIYPNTYQPITRSTSISLDLKAFVAYENSDFKTAQLAFETLLKTDNNTSLKFYYALSLLNQSKFNLALEQFKNLNTSNHDYKDEALWYTALIYLQQEDFNNAKTTLETLDGLNSTFKSQEREVLLAELKGK